MAHDTRLVIDFALRRGLLSPDQVAELDGASDPLAVLVAKKILKPEDGRLLEGLLSQYERDQEIAADLTREGVLTPEAAERIRARQLDSISSGKLESLQEAARALEFQIGEELGRRQEETRRFERFDRYEITRELGRGGMGVVYEARDPKLGRAVALKILRVGAKSTEVERFRRESQVMARLHHPGIVGVFDVGEVKDQPYFVMELVQGKDLRKSVEQKLLQRRDAVDAVRQAAEAVAFAHDNGVLHRDLKPENILVTPEKKSVVMDFGLAKIQEGLDRSLSVSGELMGTPAYMSPEQARGKWSDVDARTDVWGLGATLYYVLTSTPPFTGDSLNVTLNRVIHADPLPPRVVDPTVHIDVATICLKALEKRRERRYATAREFADDLRRYLAGEPIVARPPSLAYRAYRWVSKRRVILLTAAASIVLGLAGWWGLTSWSRSRSFKRGREAAEAAFLSRNWAQARFEAERALEIRGDARLREIAGESRRRIAEAEAYRRLQEKMKPVDGLIRDTRQFFYIKIIDLHGRLARVEEALGDLNRFLDQPEVGAFADGWRVLGIGWYLVGESARAEEALLRAEKIAPEDGWVNLYLARIYMERSMAIALGKGGDREELSKRWTRRASELMQRTVKGWEGAEEIDRVVAQAYRALAEGKVAEVVRLCTEGWERHSQELGSEEFWNLLGWVREGEERVKAYSQAVDRRPHYAWAYYVRATALFDLKKPEAALADFDTLLRLNPGRSEFHAFRGRVKAELRDWKGAIADYTEALRLDDRSSITFLHRGIALFQLSRVKEAIADFDAALRLNQKSAEGFACRGLAYFTLGENKKAIEDCAAALGLDNKLANTYYIRGRARSACDDAEGALDDFGEAIGLDPKFADAYFYRAVERGVRGDKRGMLDDFHRALEVAPPGWPHRETVQKVLDASSDHP